MTMFYAGTPITCIWCDQSRYMTSHVVLVIITTFRIWPLPDICDKYARVASTAYTLDIHFVTNAISSGIRIDKINRTMIHF